MAVTMALAGDTMLGRGVADEIDLSGPRGLFSDGLREVFAEADLAVVNLECCVSTRGQKWDVPGKPFHFRAPPAAADALTGLGVDCVTLANNHALDYGPDALLDSLDILERAGIRCVGAGADVEDARRSVVLAAGGVEVAVVGATDHPADFAAGPGRPGVALADLARRVPGHLREQVGRLRDRHDVVLVLPHWGPNMTREPLRYVRRAAEDLLDAGATLIAGSSAHVFHGVAWPVIFDMGDLIDDYIVDERCRNDLGLLFLVTLDGGGPSRVEAVPLRLDHCRTSLAEDADHRWIAERFTDACAALGTPVEPRGDRLVIDAPCE